ncbi:hypothetical protein [Corallococcus sp. AB011P]|uniref:hypothetical protein n=1 Tax=Corallococcus sp. AB011P TaxID=2316735 RepID=UPI0018F5498C|nr:hypothetical protein [Corallococcus sp. AB011P]
MNPARIASAISKVGRDDAEAVLRLAVLRRALDQYGERFFVELQRQEPVPRAVGT